MMNRAAFGLFEDAELEVSRKANKLLFISELSPVPGENIDLSLSSYLIQAQLFFNNLAKWFPTS